MATEAKKRQQMDAILRAWEKQSMGRMTIDARFVRLDVSKVWGNTEYRGRASLQSPSLAYLELKKVDKQKKPPTLVPHEEIICTGSHVLQYAYETQQIFVFPLAKDQRKRALDEGPLPFLFNTRAAELTARYDLSLVDENKDVYLIGVMPRLETDQESFSKAFIWLNKVSFLPDKLVLFAPNEQDTKEYTFTLINENKPFDPGTFKGQRRPGWKVVENPVAPQAPPANRRGARLPAQERK
ncbi:MAG: outer-membrane lipoprotein carrier protein LolA [Isosphaeraceae bacterium]|nr:outer-membrane lipoprotein carrier protein LolA [Isosphaeraceae bacterium]